MKLPLPAALVLVLWPLSAAAQEPSPDALYQRALALHDSGDYSGAIAIYKELLKTAPENETVRYELTYSTLAKGDTTETIRLATEGARKPGPTQVRYFELLGNAYDAEHRTKEAVEAFKRGIKVDPSYAPIHFNLGVAYGGSRNSRTHAKRSRTRSQRTRAMPRHSGASPPSMRPTDTAFPPFWRMAVSCRSSARRSARPPRRKAFASWSPRG